MLLLKVTEHVCDFCYCSNCSRTFFTFYLVSSLFAWYWIWNLFDLIIRSISQFYFRLTDIIGIVRLSILMKIYLFCLYVMMFWSLVQGVGGHFVMGCYRLFDQCWLSSIQVNCIHLQFLKIKTSWTHHLKFFTVCMMSLSICQPCVLKRRSGLLDHLTLRFNVPFFT